MISKKKFKKLADKHLFVLEKPRNAFGKTELEVFGKDELYKQLQLYIVSQQRELLEWLSSEEYFNIPKDEISEILDDWKTYNSNCG